MQHLIPFSYDFAKMLMNFPFAVENRKIWVQNMPKVPSSLNILPTLSMTCTAIVNVTADKALCISNC